jgi:hypothetical protein
MTFFDQILKAIQKDPGNRGLAKNPERNLFNQFPNDFQWACQSIAENLKPRILIVTGFIIPSVSPPLGETDGPLGAVFLSKTLTELAIPVEIWTDSFAISAIAAGLEVLGLKEEIPLQGIPTKLKKEHYSRLDSFTHIIALERVGPNHVTDSIRNQQQAILGHQKWLAQGSPQASAIEIAAFEKAVESKKRNCCYTMRGQDITELMQPAHLLMPEAEQEKRPVTIGIGDGGNEIGMGKMPYSIIAENITQGGLIACRVPTDYLIVAGVSNWGAYALAAGIGLARNANAVELFHAELEKEVLEKMVRQGPLVDGVTGKKTPTVDGLSWEQYMEPFNEIRTILSEL